MAHNIRDLYRGINGFKRGYQPRNNLAKDDNGDLLADSHNILNRWKNYFSQLLNVHNISDVGQIEVHTYEPLVPGPSRLEVEIAIAKLKKYKSPGSDQIPAELIQAGGNGPTCRNMLVVQFRSSSHLQGECGGSRVCSV
jgi:hypothetical protein